MPSLGSHNVITTAGDTLQPVIREIDIGMKTLGNAACQSETLRRIGELSLTSPRQWGKMTDG